MRAYEFMFILDPTLDDAASLAVVERVEGIIQARGGEVVSLKPWERRRLAYAIDGHQEGLYMLCYFDAQPDVIDAIESRVRLAEGVIRFLILRIDEETRERDQAGGPEAARGARPGGGRGRSRCGSGGRERSPEGD